MFLSSLISESVFIYVLETLYCRTLCSGSLLLYKSWILCILNFGNFPFFFLFFHLRNDNACFLELCVWEARIISLQMLQINITWHCKTSDFWQKHLFPFSLQPKTSSFQSRCLSPVLGWFLSLLIILPPQSPATYMVLYSLEALPGVGQPTSSPAQWTPSPLPPWVTWLAKRSVHLPHLLVHLGDPQPETEHIS